MQKIILILIIIGFISCKKDEPIYIQSNPLIGNWKSAANLYEFTNDSMFEYIGAKDLLYYSGYTIKENTLIIKGAYIKDWGITLPYDTTYTVTFHIKDDSLFFNGSYKGKRF